MLEARSGDIQVPTANVIHSLIVDEESAVAVFNCGVGGEYGVVRLDDGGGDAGSGVDGEFELGFLAVVC
jgi:hypothetical protein